VASARESGLFDEKNEGKKSLDTVTKVFKVLICYRKSLIDLIVIFVEEELIFWVSSITKLLESQEGSQSEN
jgi:hypothetical protein